MQLPASEDTPFRKALSGMTVGYLMESLCSSLKEQQKGRQAGPEALKEIQPHFGDGGAWYSGAQSLLSRGFLGR